MTIRIETFSNRLRIRFRHKGTSHCAYLGSANSDTDRARAKLTVAKLEIAISDGSFNGDLKAFLATGEAAFTSIEDRLKRRLTTRWNVTDATLCDKLLPKFGNILSKSDADRFRNWLFDVRGIKPSSASRYISALRAVAPEFFGHIHIKVAEPPPEKAFTESETAAILSAFRSESSLHYDFVFTAFNTAMRLGEIKGLRCGSIDFDKRLITVHETMRRKRGTQEFERAPTKTHKARLVPFGPHLARVLFERLSTLQNVAELKEDTLVFGSPPIDDYKFVYLWRRVLKAEGISYRPPYNMRHTCISHWLAAGIEPLSVSRMVGNTPEILFSKYASQIRPPTAPELFEPPPLQMYET